MANVPCGCPVPTQLPDAPDPTCNLQMARVEKFFISRTKIWESTTGVLNDVTEYATLSEWSAGLSASDSERIMVLPAHAETTITPGEAKTVEFGGDTRNTGAYNPTTLSFSYDGLPSDTVQAIKDLTCEPKLYAAWADENKVMWHGLETTMVIFFEIAKNSFTMPDYGLELDGLLMNTGQFQLVQNWSTCGLTGTTPIDYDPFTDLVNS